jgi:asparagine synthase (glutamine-hydrolysing)
MITFRRRARRDVGLGSDSSLSYRPVAVDSLYVMSPMEIVVGLPLGHIGTLAAPADPTATPRQALEQVVRGALMRPPCGVAFSGGRDSSAVLAVATHVARREGLPEPVAVTKVFPNAPRTDERDWQEAVVRHLKLREWQRLTIDDELDLVGPLAAERLVAHGVVWSPTIHGDAPMVEVLRGGTLIDGEGGDEVLGVAQHRIAPVTRLLRAPRPLQWPRIRSALGALAPATLRARRVGSARSVEAFSWLRPRGRDLLVEALQFAEIAKPLPFSASVRMVPRRRTQVFSLHNRRVLARKAGVDVQCPLLDAAVAHALARDGGRLGRGDRTTVLRALVPDLLPDAVLARTTKAEFGGAYMNRHTRDFAESWTGDGVDHELVDADELRRLWLTETRIAPTAALLQAAWLGAVGRRSGVPGDDR